MGLEQIAADRKPLSLQGDFAGFRLLIVLQNKTNIDREIYSGCPVVPLCTLQRSDLI